MKLANATTLKGLMEQKRFTHTRLARAAGCSRGFISHLTAGRKNSCRPHTAELIAEALDVPLDLLFLPNGEPAGSDNGNRGGRAA